MATRVATASAIGYETHRIRGTERAARQALETIDRCIATRERQSKNLSEFLSRTVSAGN